MRQTRFPWLLLAVLAGLGCKSDTTEVEAGAVLLRVTCQEGAALPDALRVWAYDDGGQLWDGVRIPAEGPLVPTSAQELGTILISPGPIAGSLRVHVQGYLAGARSHDGVLAIASLEAGDRIYDLQLASEMPRDVDHDGVPDLIDDCLGAANPLQGGCPPGTLDAAVAADGGADTAGDTPLANIDTRLGLDAGADVEGAADSAHDVAVAWDVPAIGKDVSPDVVGRGDLPLDKPAEADTGVSPADLRPESVDARGFLDGGRPEVFDGSASDGDARSDGVADGRRSDGAADASPDAAFSPDGPTCPDGGTCDKSQGAACSWDGECVSGACADGVCCTSACIGPCRSCNQPNANGVCQGYVAGSDPEQECDGGNTCNGAGACGPAPEGLPNGQLCGFPTQCESGFCKDGVCCDTACTEPCNSCGTGTCQQVKRADDFPECTGTMTCNPKGSCVAR